MSYTNEITIRFSFLNKGSKLSANYKPRTSNYTITGTVITHEELEVSHNLINSVVVADEVKGGRATLCFNSREEAISYIKMINDALTGSNEAQVQVITTNKIIYNANETGKSMTIFNPEVVELDEIKAPVINKVPSRKRIYSDETVPFLYNLPEAVPVETKSNYQVKSARTSLENVQNSDVPNSKHAMSPADRLTILEAGFSAKDISSMSKDEIDRVLKLTGKLVTV